MRAVSPPRQIERENEMIVISYRLFVWCNAGLPCAAGMAKRIIKKKRSEWEIRTRLVSPAFPMGKVRAGDPARSGVCTGQPLAAAYVLSSCEFLRDSLQ